jgi:GNAT superfamily N-acetyltransferase
MSGPTERIADLERNLWTFFAVLGTGSEGSVLDTPTRLVTRAPIKQPPYNGVWRFFDEGTGTIAEQVDDLIAAFVERGVAPVWIAHPTTPPEVREHLAGLGWEREHIAGMARALSGLPELPRTPDDIDIHEASGDDEDAWLHLVTWRYGLDAGTAPYLREIYRGAVGTHTRLWVAKIDEEPVSKVAMHVSEGVAGIYAVATTEKARGRGLAGLLTLTALHAAAADGIERSVLHSTPMAHSLYARLGYEDVAPFDVWSMPNTLHL